MTDQMLVRSVPEDLRRWISRQAHERGTNKNQIVIKALEQLRDTTDDYLPLFSDELAVDQELEVDSFPFSFIDLFAGIGGFRLALESIGGNCVFTSEWDKFSQQTYEKWFGEKPAGDINDVDPYSIPDHDILAAGFPCQPFSIAGVSKKRSLGVAHGFKCEKQGNLFFKICEIVAAKTPPILILENVKNLKSHDKKRTWAVIESELQQLGYTVHSKIIDACDWVPQHRERIFIVCLDKEVFGADPAFHFPEPPMGPKPELGDILDDNPDDKYTLTDHLWNYLQEYKRKHEKKGNGFGYGLNEDLSGITRTLSARYYKDGSEVLISQGKGTNPRRLTIPEAAKLMGYGNVVTEREDIPVSDTQAYKQFGNSVVPAVVAAVGKQCLPLIRQVWQEQSGGCILKNRAKLEKTDPKYVDDSTSIPAPVDETSQFEKQKTVAEDLDAIKITEAILKDLKTRPKTDLEIAGYTPDFAWKGRKLAILVNLIDSVQIQPASEASKASFQNRRAAIEQAGWKVVTVQEEEVQDTIKLKSKLEKALKEPRRKSSKSKRDSTSMPAPADETSRFEKQKTVAEDLDAIKITEEILRNLNTRPNTNLEIAGYTPDFAWKGRKLAILVNLIDSVQIQPASEASKASFQNRRAAIEQAGWKVVTVQEEEVQDTIKLKSKLEKALKEPRRKSSKSKRDSTSMPAPADETSRFEKQKTVAEDLDAIKITEEILRNLNTRPNTNLEIAGYTPDFAWKGRKLAILVNLIDSVQIQPASETSKASFQNRRAAIEQAGWKVVTVQEEEVQDTIKLKSKLEKALKEPRRKSSKSKR